MSECVSRLWSAYLGVVIPADDAMAMLSLLKVARFKSGSLDPDHAKDGANYMLIAQALRELP